MRPNRLRELLRAGQPTFGTHIHTVWPAVAELAGHAGVFDYVEFVGEYAPYDLFALENLARAVDKPYLDMGVRHFCMGWDVGILFDWFKTNGAQLRTMTGAFTRRVPQT